MLETRLSRGSRKAELFDNLFQSIDEEFGDSRSVVPFHEWVERSSISLDGRSFSFERHEYLVGIYEAMSGPKVREINIEKAAQMGVTVAEILESFHGMKNGRYPKGGLYLLPTERHMQRVSQTKIQPIIDENPGTLQKWIEKTDSMQQKRIGQSNFILHGMGSRISLKSYSVDSVRFDELEEIEDWTHVGLAEERMSHSEVEWLGQTLQGGSVHRFSVPSLPEYGINSFFAGKPSDSGFGYEIEPSDQRYWMLKCRACGEYTCLEDEFPECIIEISVKDQKAIRVCHKCHGELDISKGEWVAKKPGQRAVGFHISQLFSAYVNPWKLLDQYRKKKNLTTLFNDKIRADGNVR
jgi:phage terminase large subunit GpA-like protein